MRCLVVADFHYSLPQFDWLLAAGRDFDLVIFAGDVLDVASPVDFRAKILVVIKYLSLRQMTRVIVCSGNHDLDDRARRRKDRPLGRRCQSNWPSPPMATPSPSMRRFHRVPVVGRAAREGAASSPVREAAARAGPSGSGSITRRRSIRRSAGPASDFGDADLVLDRAASAGEGHRAMCTIAVQPRRLVGRPGRQTWVFNTGLQTAARRFASCSISTRVRRSGLRPAKRNASTCCAPLAAAGGGNREPAGLAYIVRSDCRSAFPCIGNCFSISLAIQHRHALRRTNPSPN